MDIDEQRNKECISIVAIRDAPYIKNGNKEDRSNRPKDHVSHASKLKHNLNNIVQESFQTLPLFDAILRTLKDRFIPYLRQFKQFHHQDHIT